MTPSSSYVGNTGGESPPWRSGNATRRTRRVRDYFEVESRAFCARRIVANSFINRNASRPLKS
jgi:hypothetical protein